MWKETFNCVLQFGCPPHVPIWVQDKISSGHKNTCYNITLSFQHSTKENTVSRRTVIIRWESIVWELRKTVKSNVKTGTRVKELYIIN
jgi:hypothetical protein